MTAAEFLVIIRKKPLSISNLENQFNGQPGAARGLLVRQRLRSNHSGVSEVIGTILILLITVILFSTIVVWVFTLPTPRAGINVSFEGDLSGNYVGGIWQGASVNLVHLGGGDLNEGGTRVYLTIDADTEVLKTRGTFFDGMSLKTYGVEDPDGVWRIGADWSYLNETIPQGADVSVLVVDLDKGIVLWTENLSGIGGEDAPVFLDKWFDSDTSTANRDPISPGDLFTVFAHVIDVDDDLNPASVWAYLTFGTSGVPLGYIQLLDDGGSGDQVANDGVFTRQLPYTAQQNWDGGIIILNATDTGGRESATRLILRVGLPTGGGGFFPFGGTWNSTLGGIGQGDSGPNGDQGWNIYNATGLPSAGDPAGSPTRVFAPGETVYVIVRATTIHNAANINSFLLRDAAGFTLYPPTKEFDSRDPAKNDPAFTQTATSPFFEYQYSFAAPASNGTYTVELTLKDNAGNAFLFGTDSIWVSTGGSPPLYPRLVTYRDPNRDGDLSDLEEWNTFNTTDPLFIRIFVQDRDNDLVGCGIWFPPPICPLQVNINAGDVEVLDYYGAAPVKRTPGSKPVSLIALHPYDTGAEHSYLLYINLLRRDQDPWLPGPNFYTLRIRHIADFGLGGTTAESYTMMSTQIQVVAPLSIIDIVASTEQGTGDDDRGVYWYESSFGWQEHEIDLLPKDSKKPLAMATGDLNGDSKIDVVIGLDAKEVTNIVAYFNLDYGRTWRREFINQFAGDDNYRAESLAIGDLDGDGDGELIAGVKDAGGLGVGVIVFWNDGLWTGQQLQYSESGGPPPMQSVAVGDINNDGRADVISGDDSGIVNYYCNNVRGGFLPGADTPCPGKASLGPPGAASAFNQGVKVGDAAGIEHNSLRLGRMEGLEAADPTLDIVVSNGANLIIYRTRVVGVTATFIRYDVVEVGTPITRNILSFDVGDMNNDGRLDIVAAIDPSGEDPGVYRLRNGGMNPGPPPTFNPWLTEVLPHTTIDPDEMRIARLGKIKDIALGDTDNDGDLDIVFIGDSEMPQLNNVWHLENRGDEAASYVETNVYTDGFFKRKEKAFSVEMAFIDL